jgi:hypothetical protein
MGGVTGTGPARSGSGRHGRGRRVEDAKTFIWQLFALGGTDADTATTCLLALDRTARQQRRGQKLIGRRRADDWP